MSYVEYEKAQKLGLKAFKNAVSKGENEYLPVLDEILEGVRFHLTVSLERAMSEEHTHLRTTSCHCLIIRQNLVPNGRHCVTARSKREFVIRSRFTNI